MKNEQKYDDGDEIREFFMNIARCKDEREENGDWHECELVRPPFRISFFKRIRIFLTHNFDIVPNSVSRQVLFPAHILKDHWVLLVVSLKGKRFSCLIQCPIGGL